MIGRALVGINLERAQQKHQGPVREALFDVPEVGSPESLPELIGVA